MTETASTVELLVVDTLIVDHDVQRPLDEQRADRMAADLRPEALGVLHVSQRGNGAHHIIDGQHRAAALRRAGLGDTTVRCVVYTGLSRATEAAMFVRLNESRNVMAIDRFRIRVVEGDPVAVAITDLLTEYGWRVQSSTSDGSFSAVAAIETVFRGAKMTDGEANVDACHTLLGIITAAFGHNADGVRREIVAGLGRIVLRHDIELDTRKLVGEMSTFPGGARGIVGKAKALKDLRNINVSDAMAEFLVSLHNKGKRTRRLPEWRTS
jgi:hypothetical protein